MNESAAENLQVRSNISQLSSAVLGHLLALAFVAIGGVVAMLLEVHLNLREPSLIFLASVFLTAIVAGLGPSLLAAGVSVLVYDFFFTQPYHTFSIHDPQDILSITVFLAVAVLTSHLTARIRNQSATALAREARTAALYAFTRDLSAAVRPDELMGIIVRHIGEQFLARAILLLPEKGVLKSQAAYPPGASLPLSQREAVSFAWVQGRFAPLALRNAVGERWAHISIGTIRGEVAVLSLNFPDAVNFTEEIERLLDAFTQQAGVALERCLLESSDGPPTSAIENEEEGSTLPGRLHALEDRLERMQQDVLALRAAAHDIAKVAGNADPEPTQPEHPQDRE